MTTQCRPLIEVLAEIPDFRKQRGKRYPLSAILALACVATMCGYKSYSAIAEWGRNYQQQLVQALGFTHSKTPCATTLHTVFRNVDSEELEAKLDQWAESVLEATASVEGELEGVSMDGKTLRGSRKQGATVSHLLSALSHRLGLTLAQQGVKDTTNEIGVVGQLLQGLVLAGRVMTMDALLTQREVAQSILSAGGDYVMVVKGNQPQLLADIQEVFAEAEVPAEAMESVTVVGLGHGRIETRRLTAASALVGYSDWPGLAQVFKLERRVEFKKDGKMREAVVYGVSSLSAERADPAGLLGYCRHHWHIENKSHWVRDVTFDEDHSQVRCGNIPQVMAILRTTVIGLMRWSGEGNIAAACRRFAAQPWSALALIGV